MILIANIKVMYIIAKKGCFKMKTLYFDCFSGISGDMVIGSLIDAGGDPNYLKKELKKLAIDDEYDLKWDKDIKNGITSTKFDVILKENSNDGHVHDHSHQADHDGQDHVHTDAHSGHDHDHHDGAEDHEAVDGNHQHHHNHDHHHDHHHRAY